MIAPPSALSCASIGAHFLGPHGHRSAKLRDEDNCAEQQDHEDGFHDFPHWVREKKRLIAGPVPKSQNCVVTRMMK